jgi:hypothetical protein
VQSTQLPGLPQLFVLPLHGGGWGPSAGASFVGASAGASVGGAVVSDAASGGGCVVPSSPPSSCDDPSLVVTSNAEPSTPMPPASPAISRPLVLRPHDTASAATARPAPVFKESRTRQECGDRPPLSSTRAEQKRK